VVKLSAFGDDLSAQLLVIAGQVFEDVEVDQRAGQFAQCGALAFRPVAKASRKSDEGCRETHG
jgi:hypothetical protein